MIDVLIETTLLVFIISQNACKHFSDFQRANKKLLFQHLRRNMGTTKLATHRVLFLIRRNNLGAFASWAYSFKAHDGSHNR
jgi:hypothetical protein